MHSRSAITALLLTAALLAALPAVVHGRQDPTAQIRLTLLDEKTGSRVSGARVLLQPGGSEYLSQDGVVELRGLRLGAYVLTIEADGYRAWQDTLRVERPTSGASTILLEPAAIPLDPITAAGRMRVPHLERAGFYSRRSSGFGHFVEREAIEKRQPSSLLEMFYTMPSSQVVNLRGRRYFVLRRLGEQCIPALFVDGVLLRDPLVLEEIRPESVEAFELYVGSAGTPLEWRRNSCGSLLIWTRR